MSACLVFGDLLDFTEDPGGSSAAPAVRHTPDGALWIVDGHIRARGARAAITALAYEAHATVVEHDHRGCLVLPGLIDCHLHYPQIGVMASWGGQLLDWLEGYTFPAEAAFADVEVANQTAEFVMQRLLAQGTTTASVFATVHAHSVDAFMAAAERAGARMLCGKVMMDRNAPAALCDSVASGERDIPALIARWHGRGRLRYTLTPRFAPTSSPGQLALAGALLQSAPGLHLQSHLSENAAEIAWVQQLFPQAADYYAVYEQHGLTGPQAIYGHCLHLNPRERAAMAQAGTAIAFCPTSNLFLGSGVFDVCRRMDEGLKVGLATDVGGGSSLSLLQTQAAAYQHSQLAGAPLPPLRGWYLATLGGARALGLDQMIGNFAPGKEADLVVLDGATIPELAWRLARAERLEERLFAFTMLGDARCVVATYLLGRLAHRQR